MLVKCMFSGSGGQGSALMAKLVCEGAMRENLKVVMTQTLSLIHIWAFRGSRYMAAMMDSEAEKNSRLTISMSLSLIHI